MDAYFFWNMTILSSFRSDMSMLSNSFDMAGLGLRVTLINWEYTRPLFGLYGSKSVPKCLWWRRWYCTHSYIEPLRKYSANQIFSIFIINYHLCERIISLVWDKKSSNRSYVTNGYQLTIKILWNSSPIVANMFFSCSATSVVHLPLMGHRRKWNGSMCNPY